MVYATIRLVKLLILYKPSSEHARSIDDFVHMYQARYPEAKIELHNIDRRDGAAEATLYDIMSFPAILALRIDGQPLQVWQGTTLPLIDEVAAYMVER